MPPQTRQIPIRHEACNLSNQGPCGTLSPSRCVPDHINNIARANLSETFLVHGDGKRSARNHNRNAVAAHHIPFHQNVNLHDRTHETKQHGGKHENACRH